MAPWNQEAQTAGAVDRRGERADQLLIGVAILGAITGAALGTALGGAFPVVFGGLGTALGGGFASGVWLALTERRG